MLRIYAFFLVLSILVGLFWLIYGRIYVDYTIPFSWSGLFGAIWFLPIFASVNYQDKNGLYYPGLVLLSESTAAFISGIAGPLGWISLQFGLVQGMASEIIYFRFRSGTWAVLGAAGADLALMAFHPNLRLLETMPLLSWFGHSVGLVASSLILHRLIQSTVHRFY